MSEAGLTKNQILSELSRSPHGKLAEYLPIGRAAAKSEAEFLAHLIAWDRAKGQIRDAKVALPIVSLSEPSYPDEFIDNSLAHVALLGPRELVRAYRFALEVRLPSRMRRLKRVIEAYLRDKEGERNWDRLALQHRAVLKELYALTHIKPSAKADAILFKGEHPAGSLFETVAMLGKMSPAEAAGTIIERKIPFLIAMGALGKKMSDPDLVLALIKQMSPTELITNTKMLEKLGVKTNPALRGAFTEALEKASKSTKNVLKTTQAVEAIDDEELKTKLRGVQDKQIAALSGVEGNWLVLADKSGSMTRAIELGRTVAATLAKLVKGKVTLIFFDTTPRAMDVTGKSLDEIKAMTRHVTANGGTSIGCGVQYAMDNKLEVDGIAIVSDGGDNTPPYFHTAYQSYVRWSGKEVPVYLYHCDGESDALTSYMRMAKLDIQKFEINQQTDYYSLPDLVSTMRTNRYSLVDEIMATPLLRLDKVLKSKGKEVLAHA